MPIRATGIHAAILLGAFAVGCAPRQHAPAVAHSDEPTIRVRIVHSVPEVVVVPPEGAKIQLVGNGDSALEKMDGDWIVRVTGDRVEVESRDVGRQGTSDMLRVTSPPGSPILIRDVPVGVGWEWERREDRTYEGVMEFTAKDDGTLNVILELAVEEYLRGVVPAEIGDTSPTEALRAQAVAARSETMTALAEQTYAGPGFDICADVECQVFAGAASYAEAADAAVRDTRGVILSYGGQPIPAYYASTCGGHSEDVANVWPERERGIPVWRAHPDGPHAFAGAGSGAEGRNLTTEQGARDWIESRPNAYCNTDFHPDLPEWTHKNFRWETEVSAEDLSTMVARHQDIGRVSRIEALERGPSDRMIRARFVGEDGTFETGPELAIRRVWDPPLRSAAFIVDPVGDPDRPDAFRIRGAGYGHGVGMCQVGAMARAIEGQSYAEILAHYYREADITKVYE